MSNVEPLGESLVAPGWTPPGIDTTRAHPARMYDYFLGGKDNFPVDREAAEIALKAVPEARAMSRGNRDFLGRAVRHLAEHGFTQFLDLGTGIPGPGNTGEVARAVNPLTSIAYVDNDPSVVAHSRALLAGAAPDLTSVVLADIREPEAILRDDAVRAVLDFDKPIAVLMVAVLHFVKDEEDPAGIVKAFMDAVPAGSHLVISHITRDFEPERAAAGARGYDRATAPIVLRTYAEIEALFDDLDVLEPGVVHVPSWRPDGEIPAWADQVWGYGGIGRKPKPIPPGSRLGHAARASRIRS